MKTAAADLDRATEHLDDYVRGALDEADAERFEDDLFARALAGAAPELTFRVSLEATLRTMSARGTVEPWITARDVERLKDNPALRVMVYELDLEHAVGPEVPPGTDLVITRIPVDLRGVGRLEAEVLGPNGQLVKRMPDITFDPLDGAVYACCEAELARTASAAPPMITRVWATGDDSERRLLLELPLL
jgi:hypothetical protein